VEPVAGVFVGDTGKAAAVRYAEGVGAGEDDHVLKGEVLLFEVIYQLGGVEERRWQVDRVVCKGHPAVAAPGGHLVAKAAGEHDAVPGGEGEDVGAGDHAGALRLQGSLGAVDHVEEPEARPVGNGILPDVLLLGGTESIRTEPSQPCMEVGASLY
ncbi:unnamed protein product, partial [Urochloa humidicola]